MTSDMRVLIVQLSAFWLIWAIIAVAAKRSVIPVIPFIPLGLGIGGYLLNRVHPWIGTIAVSIGHIAILWASLAAVVRHPASDDDKDSHV